MRSNIQECFQFKVMQQGFSKFDGMLWSVDNCCYISHIYHWFSRNMILFLRPTHRFRQDFPNCKKWCIAAYGFVFSISYLTKQSVGFVHNGTFENELHRLKRK